MGKKQYFYIKYAVNVRFAPILSFVSSMATDGPVTHLLRNLDLGELTTLPQVLY